MDHNRINQLIMFTAMPLAPAPTGRCSFGFSVNNY